MWEIRILENSYSLRHHVPFSKRQRDKVLTGNIKTKNEALKILKNLYNEEDAKESKDSHADNIVRKRWDTKDSYTVEREYCEPIGGDCGGVFERVYLRFYKA